MKMHSHASSEIRGQSFSSVERVVLAELFRNETGQALIELAVSSMLVCILILGLIQCGYWEYESIELVSAAQAGAQYGAQSGTSAIDNSGMQKAALSDAYNVPGAAATASHFCSCSDGTSSTCLGTDCPSSHLVEYVKVVTTATVMSPFRLSSLPQNILLSSQAVMRVGQ